MIVWCAVSANQVIGPYYPGHLIVNHESYLRLLNNLFLPMLPGLPPNTVSQQDGAPFHYGISVRQLFDEKLLASWIGRGVLYLGQHAPQILRLLASFCGDI